MSINYLSKAPPDLASYVPWLDTAFRFHLYEVSGLLFYLYILTVVPKANKGGKKAPPPTRMTMIARISMTLMTGHRKVAKAREKARAKELTKGKVRLGAKALKAKAKAAIDTECSSVPLFYDSKP